MRPCHDGAPVDCIGTAGVGQGGSQVEGSWSWSALLRFLVGPAVHCEVQEPHASARGTTWPMSSPPDAVRVRPSSYEHHSPAVILQTASTVGAILEGDQDLHDR